VYDFFIDGLYLPVTLTAAYNEIIGKATYLACIQQNDIGCLFFTGSFYSFMRYL